MLRTKTSLSLLTPHIFIHLTLKIENDMDNQLYKGTETFQLLIPADSSRSVIEEWMERGVQSDIRLRRARTRGCVVVETRDVMFAAFVQRGYRVLRVNIKD